MHTTKLMDSENTKTERGLSDNEYEIVDEEVAKKVRNKLKTKEKQLKKKMLSNLS